MKTGGVLESLPKPESRWSRRDFLKNALAAALVGPAVVSCTTVSPRPKRFSTNSKLQHACIGVGGMMGEGDLQNFKQHAKLEIVALCDVDAGNLEKAAKLVPGARTYADWRELLAKEGDRLDSVNIAVPDHMHFSIAYSAIRRRKHVYCQKPMCHDVAEVRELTNAAAKQGVTTQLGTQMAATVHERLAVRWLQEGKIGKITRAYLCSNRPGAIESYRLPGPRPATGQPPPSGLNWDLWIGTAPMRPYVPDIYHPVKWRAWQDFGTGWSGDIGCHIFNAVWRGLGLQAPLSVSAKVQPSWEQSAERRADTWPQGDHITWIFPGNALVAGSTLEIEWFDGDFFPPEHIRKLYSQDLKEYPPESAMLIGTEGAMLIGLNNPPQLLPESRFKNVVRPELPPRNHYHQFVDACFGGEEPTSNFSVSGPMTETVLLGTIAVRVPGEELAWDAKRMRFPNTVHPNHLLKREYRDGWSLWRF